eukprot:scaffold649223_cov36-Prasinocladus_malaysianus.AAC.1
MSVRLCSCSAMPADSIPAASASAPSSISACLEMRSHRLRCSWTQPGPMRGVEGVDTFVPAGCCLVG